MRTHRLTRARAGTRESVDALELIERLGVRGDVKSEKDGSVSLLASKAEERMRSLVGLCSAKFAANIVTEGLNYSRLTVGARISIAGAELQITRVGKPCYEPCGIAQSGESCPLPSNCAFAQVMRGGEIRVHDEITFSSATPETHPDRLVTR